jgi:predicted phosphodiesterase
MNSRCNAAFLIFGLLLGLLLAPVGQTALAGISCEPPCVCVCPTATPTATTVPPTPTPTATLPPSTAGTLVIGHITDLHAGAVNNNPTAIAAAVTALNASGAQLVIETGDATDGALPAQWTLHDSWLIKLTIPRRLVAGNHDAWTLPSGWPASWAIDLNGYRIIGINGPFCSGTWLASQWTTAPAVIVSHVPLSLISGSCREQILSHGVALCLHGHLHIDQVTTASGVLEICSSRSGLGRYRLITLSGGHVVSY